MFSGFYNKAIKMKKTILLLLGSSVAFAAQADQKLCGYRDYFHLSDTTHPGIYIVSANSNEDVYLNVIGPRSFEMRDTDRCQSGYAHITVAYDAYNWCVLDLKDGPFMSHPSVSVSCNGLIFKGMSYDGFNTYSYTLNFD